MANLALAFDILAKDSGASKTFDKVGDASNRAGKLGKAAGFAIAAGLVAAGAAAVKFSRSSVGAFEDAARQVKGLQRITGGTVEDVSRLTFAVQQSGVGTDVFSAAIRKLSTGLNAADKSTTKLVKSQHYEIQNVPKLVNGHIEYVKRLVKVTDVQKVAVKTTNAFGFATRDAAGHIIPTQVALEKLADRFKAMPDGATKTALAIKLFGRSGADMLPFLNKGSAGIRELEKESDRLGHTLTGQDLDAIKQNVAAHKLWHAAISGLQIQVGRLLLPIMAKFATFAASVLVPIVAKLATFINLRLAPAFAAFTAGLDGAKGADYFTRLGGTVTHFRDLVVKVFKQAKTQVEEFFGGFSPKPVKVIPGVPVHAGPNRDQVDPAATTAGALGVKARAAFDSLRSSIEDNVLPAVGKLIRNIRDLAETMAKNLFPILRDVVGKLYDARGVVLPLAAAFLAINAAISVTTTAMETVKTVTEGYTKVLEVLTAVKAFFITTTDAETGAITLSTVARLRSGIVTKAETLYLWGLIAAEKVAAVASKAWAAAQWLLNAAMDANPIGLVVIAIAALVAGLIYAYKHSETFRTIVQGAFAAISAAASFMWNNVLKPVFKLWLNAWFAIIGALVNGAASAFGWVPGIGPKLKAAAKEFNKFRDQVNASLDGINKNVHVQVTGDFKAYGANAQGVATNAAMHGRASGGPVIAGRPYIVGEREPELFVPGATGRIYNSSQIASGGPSKPVLHIENLVLQKADVDRDNGQALTRGLRNLAFTMGV